MRDYMTEAFGTPTPKQEEFYAARTRYVRYGKNMLLYPNICTIMYLYSMCLLYSQPRLYQQVKTNGK
jgi:hypothetical protein